MDVLLLYKRGHMHMHLTYANLKDLLRDFLFGKPPLVSVLLSLYMYTYAYAGLCSPKHNYNSI